MKYFSFNPFGTQSIILTFECKKCQHEVESEEIYLPSPNYAEDTSSESQVEEEGYAICENCEEQYDISIFVTFAGGDGCIEGLEEKDSIDVTEIPEPPDYELEAILSNTHFYQTFKDEISKIQDLNDLNLTDEEDKKTNIDIIASAYGILFPDELIITLRKLLFTNVITCLESYLSSAFINTVISKPEHLRKFYETFKDFQKEKIALSQLFELKDKTEDIAVQAMHKVIYHNLEKVNPMFKDALKVTLPDFGDIVKDIEVRHDIVHRNGKTKDGNTITVSQDDVASLIKRVEEFVSDIDYQINKL